MHSAIFYEPEDNNGTVPFPLPSFPAYFHSSFWIFNQWAMIKQTFIPVIYFLKVDDNQRNKFYEPDLIEYFLDFFSPLLDPVMVYYD
jgi:hypothetical protein